jgi:hypothetical protein
MSECIEGTTIPKFSERGVTIQVLRRNAPNQTLEELQASNLFEVRWTPDGYHHAVYRKSDRWMCSNPMPSEEEAWESAVRMMRGEPGYYQPPYYCQKAGKMLWSTWESVRAEIYGEEQL